MAETVRYLTVNVAPPLLRDETLTKEFPLLSVIVISLRGKLPAVPTVELTVTLISVKVMLPKSARVPILVSIVGLSIIHSPERRVEL
jgi:hypothetical protein